MRKDQQESGGDLRNNCVQQGFSCIISTARTVGFNNPADGASREVMQRACWSWRQAFNNPVPVRN